MKFTQRMLMGLGGLGLAAVLLTMLLPKAAHAVVAALVQVVNTNANPVINSAMDDPGRIPYSAKQQVSQLCAPVMLCSVSFSAVPAGKRLVVTYLSASLNASSTGMAQVELHGGPAGPQSSGRDVFVPALFQNSISSILPFAVVNTPVVAYYDAGEQPFVGIFALGTTGFITLNGYLLDCTSSPCAAIAP